jgi:hypothetical protein
VFARSKQSGNMEKMQNRLSARQKPGPSYHALKRKLVARYQHWLVAQHCGMGTKRGYMRSAIPGEKALMTATPVDLQKGRSLAASHTGCARQWYRSRGPETTEPQGRRNTPENRVLALGATCQT